MGMASKGQMTGMLGVYLAAAELTRRDLIVSITSRNARGADLLATDRACRKTWSIQVKTNRKVAGFWLLGAAEKVTASPTHIYILINVRGDARPDYYVIPSGEVAKLGRSKDPAWHSLFLEDAKKYHDRWSIFEKAPNSD
jgi:hypothetical protein